MSLYVRLNCNFFTNRKTLRLRSKLGDAAFWLPPRLWAYAAENQPDGIFENYSAAEIAACVGYPGDAQAMLEALLQASFLDDKPLRIHDWQEHNGYHSIFAERAKKAAKARWQKERTKEKVNTIQEQSREEPSIAASIASSIRAAPPEPDAHIPGVDEVLAFAAAYPGDPANGTPGPIPPDFAREYHEAKVKQKTWLNRQGVLIDWKREIAGKGWWRDQCQKWNQAASSRVSTAGFKVEELAWNIRINGTQYDLFAGPKDRASQEYKIWQEWNNRVHPW